MCESIHKLQIGRLYHSMDKCVRPVYTGCSPTLREAASQLKATKNKLQVVEIRCPNSSWSGKTSMWPSNHHATSKTNIQLSINALAHI